MGSSSSYLVGPVMQLVWDFNPKTILDVGVGTGRYGLLIRDSLEFKKDRIFDKKEWTRRVDGVEYCEPYIQDYHYQIYDKIVVGDIRRITINNYDLIIANDIIEHFVKDEGYQIINKLLRHCKHLILTTPYGLFDEGNEGKPEHEKHRSGWYESDFFGYKVMCLTRPTPLLLLIVLKGELKEVNDNE